MTNKPFSRCSASHPLLGNFCSILSLCLPSGKTWAMPPWSKNSQMQRSEYDHLTPKLWIRRGCRFGDILNAPSCPEILEKLLGIWETDAQYPFTRDADWFIIVLWLPSCGRDGAKQQASLVGTLRTPQRIIESTARTPSCDQFVKHAMRWQSKSNRFLPLLLQVLSFAHKKK